MKKRIIFNLVLFASISTLVFNSCSKQLDLYPKYGLNSAEVYNNPENYINVLAKMYAGFVLSGNQGPAGNADIADIDEGFSPYLRVYWNLQELPTDEAKCRWNDVGIPEINTMDWSSNNSFVKAMYARLFFQITMANEFIRESSDENMERREFSADQKALITEYRSEARFIRALCWTHALDLFGGNVPFMTEEDGIGAFTPPQTNPQDLLAYIESELLEIEDLMKAPKTNEYGRADQATVWFLLSHLYLNAESWTGTQRYTDCATYSEKIINSGAYDLDAKYQDLFLADNDKSTEAIWSSNCDGERTQSYGGTTFLVHAFVGGTMVAADYGITGGWQGYRATKSFTDLFVADSAVSGRFIWHTDQQKQMMDTLSLFNNGWAQGKYKNVIYVDNGNGSVDTVRGDNYTLATQVNVDFHWMRLGEAYLMYAEAAARGYGDAGKGVEYVNRLRTRANEPQISAITPEFILDERGRELQWEGKRRTDLVRFNKFTTGDYLWEWKGGAATGTSVSSHLNIYPLSADDVVANPNLTQNPGY